jgi:NADH-quinone oxidoreductase subunit J
MDISPVFFYFFAGLAIACSLAVVLKKNPVASAFSLVLTFFAFAGIYALLDAHLVAALQIFVYAGAIMVLFVFVIMLLNADTASFDMGRSHILTRIFSAVSCLAILSLFIWSFKQGHLASPVADFTPERIEAAGGNTQVLAELLFSEYILPVELTSVLLLSAIVGAVALAKRKQGSIKA